MERMVRAMMEDDVEAVARVHAEAFPRQTKSVAWVEANRWAFPRIQIFVAEEDGRVVGYVQWIEKAGLRPRAVLELEQIAVAADRRGRGVGGRLIRESLAVVRRRLSERGATLASILVTTRTDNEAQRLYSDVLGARCVAVVEDLYSADEAIMVATGPFA